ncbi:alpha/beta hydrolase [Amycolatopsis regifaucium]|uniref:Peptidase n=1 Tax=Amycolatopsis regifaucium TaxID=546365 RepID=A0A154MG04_9PSEU|nr:alpha/beta hydrolase [Amycolatopsis regifaucium]KZB83110.1 peptidase [Amycolatopsis regifaucium]OKA03235.1 peptidase [Amycolatopsis regifaucium]SFJ46205.1 alpha/beta hydrolase fold [Amycolatopsis regifaucium]
MKRIRYAVAIPAIAGTMLAGLTPAFADPAEGAGALNSTPVPSRYASQQLNWHPCAADELPSAPPPGAENMECATYVTPRDWYRPEEGRDLTIAVNRLPSSGPATESVFVNPGGPGADGRSFISRLRNQKRVRVNQEIIGFDPRGTGMSTKISCGGVPASIPNVDSRDRSPANLRRALDNQQRAAEACQQYSGDLGPLINTDQTTRDIDLLRLLLKRSKINWVGYSAGTWLGAHYAQRFPQHVGRFVLDSAVNFTAVSWREAMFRQQALGFERRWQQDFLPWLAKYDNVYHLGATAKEALQTFEDIRAAVAARPVEYGGTTITPDDFGSFAVTGVYNKNRFHWAATSLVNIRELTRQEATAEQKDAAVRQLKQAEQNLAADQLGPRPAAVVDDSYQASFWTIQCNDGPWPGDRESVVAESQRYIDKGWMLLGPSRHYQACIFWNKQGTPTQVVNGRGVPPVLMIQSEKDPATPIEGARLAHAGFEGSRMITVSDEGDHGLYAATPVPNKRLDDIVDSYLADGVLPQDQTIPGVPLLAPPGA